MLNLSYNRLSRVPPELGGCEKLERLELAGNHNLSELPFEVRRFVRGPGPGSGFWVIVWSNNQNQKLYRHCTVKKSELTFRTAVLKMDRGVMGLQLLRSAALIA